MITVQKTKSDLTAYWFAMMLVVILLGRYGREAVEWIFMKLYEFFIERTPMGLYYF